VFRKVAILACLLVTNPGGKKVGVKRRILCIKRVLLSFQHVLSGRAEILHEVPQCTHKKNLILLTNVQKCLENTGAEL
jgi:hypothetical protein